MNWAKLGTLRRAVQEAGGLAMKARLITLLLLYTLTAPLAPDTLYAAAGPRVAVLFSGSPATRFEETWGRTFLDALRRVGWVDGHTLTVECHYSEDNDERRRTLAEDFVRRKLDVIVVQSTPEALAIQRATATIPVVLVLIGDALAAGLVDSLSRPGRNITGTSLMLTETHGKGVQFLKELLPEARRIALLGNPNNASVVRMWAEARDTATRLGMEVIPAEARDRHELRKAFGTITRVRPQAMVVLIDSLTVDNRQQIVEFAAKNQLPALYGGPMFAEAGGLLVYTANFNELWRRAAST